jgi:hypothetical protein
MTTTAESLGDLIVGLLKAAATAGQLAGVASSNIYGLRAWPTQEDELPQIQLALPEEDKASAGRNGAPQFTVTATLPFLITVEAPGAEDEAGAAAIRIALGAICRAMEQSVVGHPTLMEQLQQVSFIRSHARVDGKGEEVTGQRVMMLGLEFYQGPEDFFVETDFDDLEVVAETILPTNLDQPFVPPTDWRDHPTTVVTLTP